MFYYIFTMGYFPIRQIRFVGNYTLNNISRFRDLVVYPCE